jgi:SAM-dependent methyltransferase
MATQTPDLTEEGGTPGGSIARTAETYEAIPYVSRPILRAHPARLAAVAHLFGLDPPPLATARVLELGCAGGGNIIPVAAACPDARFLGIDLGAAMIAEGQQRIAALGLGNIELRLASITDLDESIGTFDYIICHGVYSWVPEPVREKILAICGSRLAPDGVAYVSYNVLPGWRLLQPLRDAVRAGIRPGGDEAVRARQGRGLLRFLADTTPDAGAYGTALREGVAGLAETGDDYFFHEFMEPVNEPCLFADFVGAADRHGLAYLGESQLSAMFAERFGADFAAKVDRLADGIVAQQQVLDLLTGNSFRTSLLVPQEKAAAIDRAAADRRMRDLHFAVSELYQLERETDRATLVSRGGERQEHGDPLVLALLDRLFRPVPATLSHAECVAGFAEEDLAAVHGELVGLVANGVVTLSSEPLGGVTPGPAPRAFAVARADAVAGRRLTSNLLHGSVEIDDLAIFLLPYLDGSAAPDDLERLTAAALGDGRIRLNGIDQASAPERLAAIARVLVTQGLESVAANGLLEA